MATLPLAVLLVWLALVRGIKPLSELEERIRARKPDDLSPLDEKGQVDRTHLNAKGSDVVGRMVVEALCKVVPDLASRMRPAC